MNTTPEQRARMREAVAELRRDKNDRRYLAGVLITALDDLDAAEKRIAELEAEVKSYEVACLSYELHLQPMCWRCGGERPGHKPYCDVCDGVVQRAEQA